MNSEYFLRQAKMNCIWRLAKALLNAERAAQEVHDRRKTATEVAKRLELPRRPPAVKQLDRHIEDVIDEHSDSSDNLSSLQASWTIANRMRRRLRPPREHLHTTALMRHLWTEKTMYIRNKGGSSEESVSPPSSCPNTLSPPTIVI